VNVLEARGLRKRYGDTVALDDVSLSVEAGEIFVIVGPNGAGKTTLVEICEGLRRPDAGIVRLCGMSPTERCSRAIMRVQLQDSRFPDVMKVKEVLRLFGSFYVESMSVERVLSDLGMTDEANRYYGKLSGGQKQRVAIGVALMGKPRVLFLDELTTGLDPEARRTTWSLVKQIRKDDTTIVMTTHFMEEAEVLGDRVMLMNHGRIVDVDSPATLIRRHVGRARISYRGPSLESVHVRATSVMEEKTVLLTDDPDSALCDLDRTIGREKLLDLRVDTPNLEDVYLALVKVGDQ
jgi:ABC-2 type transport system ATP-binding protein